MSYCVNCGVELDETLRRCPLCGTEVINPNRKSEPDPATRPYPTKVELLERRATRRFFLLMATLMLLIPPIVCLICDVLSAGRLSWSAYVIGATAMAYVYVLIPFALEKPHPWLCLALDCGITILFLYGIAAHSSKGWFLPLALPIVLSASAAVGAVLLLFRKCRARFVRLAGVLTAAALLCVLIDLTVNLYLQRTPVISWSLFVLAPCLILALVALVLNRRARFKEEMRRRFFI